MCSCSAFNNASSTERSKFNGNLKFNLIGDSQNQMASASRRVTPGVAQIAAMAAATSSRLGQPGAATNPVPNTLLNFNALMNLNLLRNPMATTTRSAPQPIPRVVTDSIRNDSVQNCNQVNTNSSDKGIAAIVALAAADDESNDNGEEDAAAGPAACTPVDGTDVAHPQDAAPPAHEDLFNEADNSSDSSNGRCTSYLDKATRTRSSELTTECQRHRVVSPPQKKTKRTNSRSKEDVGIAKTKGSNEFYGQAKPKRPKSAPAAQEKKKKERISRRPPRIGLK